MLSWWLAPCVYDFRVAVSIFPHAKVWGIATFHGPPDMFLSSSGVIYNQLATNKFSVWMFHYFPFKEKKNKLPCLTDIRQYILDIF